MNNRHFNIKVLTSLGLSGLILTLLITCKKPERIASIKTVDAADSDISYTSAILKGDLVDLGSEPIEDHGIIVSENASFLDPVPKSGSANPQKGVFQIEFTGLIKNTTYYYKAYVTVKSDQIYGESKNFKTKDTEAPTVTAGTISAITMTSASLSGEVTSDGGEAATVRGLCWGTDANPTITNCIDTTINGSGAGTFTDIIADLTPGTQYYARTYATNSKGTSYNSTDVVFTTHDIPEVTTTDVTDITKTTAASGGNVTDDGGVDVIARGVCWDTSTGPTVDLTTKTNDGTGTSVFTSEITGLTEGTQYYLRAYATSQYGTSYGTEKSFTTLITAPGVVTGSATSVTTTSATLTGTVNANGYSTTVTFEYGLTTSYGLEATADESPVTGTSITSVSANITGLSEATTYHYRIKAVSTGGTTYGDDMEFTTSATTQPPSATTISATSVTSTSATLNGTVNANNLTTTVTFEYGLTTAYGNDVTADQSPVSGSTITAMSANISGLTASTTYHYRVKAVSSGGTNYGDDKEFTTSLPTITDFDGNVYNIITIGAQDWLQENLKTTHYNNGEIISNITGNTEWEALKSGAYCWYDNDEGTYKDTYGALYNWHTTVDVRNVCPAGWHVPTDDEWTFLTDYLGGTSDAGGKLKETGTSHWDSPNDGATNETGFTALPGGYRFNNGTFYKLGEAGYWWSSTEDSYSDAWQRYMGSSYSMIVRTSSIKEIGMSVRCIKGELPLAQPEDAIAVTASSATLNGQVNPNNASTTVTFEYGLTTSYGSEVTASESPVTGTTPVSVSAGISSLSEATTYHYRVKAVNSGGTTYSEDKTFTTLVKPTATTESATSITATTATLNGTVNANDLSTTVTFEYGLTTSYSSEVTAAESPVTGSTSTSVTAAIGSLAASTTYHYRVKAVSAGGTTYGDDMEFTTLSLPSATTGSATEVVSTSATLNGTVNANDLSTAVTFEYGLTTTYGSEITAAESPVTGSTSTSVTAAIGSLAASTTYHYRVKAVSAGGTTYGDDASFITNATLSIVTDYDGNEYNIITIGTQDWIQENLKTNHYNNGDIIPNITGNTEWEALISGAYCWYDNNEGTYKDTYGALYNWYTTVDVRNVCPAGWHVATDDEWSTLVTYLGGESIAGGKLKESDTDHWTSPNTDATNETGFTALPGGYRNDAGNFYSINYYGYWWSSTEYNTILSWYRGIYYNSSEADRSGYDKPFGLSIRCIKGELPLVQTDIATAISSVAATLNGIVNPNGASTTVSFEYGETTTYGSSVSAIQSPVSGSVPITVSADLTSLTPGTTYHYRIKAENSGGTNYGSDVVFETDPVTVSDIDGNLYDVVRIGNQIWMAENLKVTKYPDGTPILDVYPIITYTGGYRWYEADHNSDSFIDSDDSLYYVNNYGFLYSWEAIMRGYSSSNENPSGVQGVCPDGWHLPSEDEWIELIDFVAPDSYSKLIEGGTSGFDALLGGFHYGVVADPYFQSFEWEGYYWTCTYWGSDESHTRTFESWNSTIVDKINSANAYKWNHMSIRCIKDP